MILHIKTQIVVQFIILHLIFSPETYLIYFFRNMNLRHKKPINSYKGQANCDKNEFNDDDFKHQTSPMKKFNHPSGQQIYKYSKILAKFINNSNQYYRQKLKNGKCLKTEPQNSGQEGKIQKKQKNEIQFLKMREQPKQKNYIPQIQTPKIQSQIKKQTIKNTPFKRKEELHNYDSSFKKQEKPKQVPFNQQTIEEPPTPKTQTGNNYPQNNNPYFQNMPNMSNMMGMYQPGLNAMNMQGFPNNMMSMAQLGSYQDPNSQQLIMRLAMYDQILKSNQMKGTGSMMNLNMNPNMNPNMSMGNYLNMSNMRSPQEMQNMNPTAMNMNNFMNNQILAMMQNQNLKQMYPMMGMNLNLNVQAPIHNLTQVYLKKQEQLFEPRRPNPNLKVKRANYHVGLAYHIYLANLQKQGNDMRNPMQYDPTLTSKRIKRQQEETRQATRGNRRQK